MAVGSRVIEAGFCYRVTVTEVSAQRSGGRGRMCVLVSLACNSFIRCLYPICVLGRDNSPDEGHRTANSDTCGLGIVDYRISKLEE